MRKDFYKKKLTHTDCWGNDQLLYTAVPYDYPTSKPTCTKNNNRNGRLKKIFPHLCKPSKATEQDKDHQELNKHNESESFEDITEEIPQQSNAKETKSKKVKKEKKRICTPQSSDVCEKAEKSIDDNSLREPPGDFSCGMMEMEDCLAIPENAQKIEETKKKSKKKLKTKKLFYSSDAVESGGVCKRASPLCDDSCENLGTKDTAKSNESSEQTVSKKKKKKRHFEEAVLDVDMKDTEENLDCNSARETVTKKKKKKKKKKKNRKEEPASGDQPQIPEKDTGRNELLSRMSETSLELQEHVSDIVGKQSTDNVSSVKRKQKKSKGQALENITENDLTCSDRNTRKKRKRSHESTAVKVTIGEKQDGCDLSTDQAGSVEIKKKKKTSQADVETTVTNENSKTTGLEVERTKTKKKKKRRHDEEVTNDEAKQTLEDNSKGFKRPKLELVNTTENVPTKGQWKTASFNDDNRTNKFLRLMGAMKISDASLDSQQELSQKSNFAMDAEQESVVNAALEEQFSKAVDLVVNKTKGKGIGFKEPEGANKKFHIDATKSKSVKFDED